MVEAPNHVNEVILVVCSHSEVLSRHVHLLSEIHFPLVVNDEAPVACECRFALQTTDQQKLVIRYVDGLEVVRDVIKGVAFIIL